MLACPGRLTWYFTEAHSGISRPSCRSNRRKEKEDQGCLLSGYFTGSLESEPGELDSIFSFFGGSGILCMSFVMYIISALLSPNTSISCSQTHDLFLDKILRQLLRTEDFRTALWLSSDYLYWLKYFCGLNSLFNQTSIYDSSLECWACAKRCRALFLSFWLLWIC